MYHFSKEQYEHFFNYLETLDCYITSGEWMKTELDAFKQNEQRQIAALVCQNTTGQLKFPAPFIRILYVLQGEVRLLIDGKEFYYQAGALILSNKFTRVDYEELCPDTKMVCFYFKPEYFSDSLLAQFSEEKLLYRFFVESLNKEEQVGRYYVFQFNIYDDVHFYSLLLLKQVVKMRYFDNKVTKSAFLLLIVEISQLANEALCLKDSVVSNRLLMYEILAYMENHLTTVSLEKTAKIFHFHPNYLSSLLKKYIGLTFTECLIDLRLKYAKKYLEQTDLSIQEITEKVGYSDKAFFFRVFKKNMGVTPGAYRKQLESISCYSKSSHISQRKKSSY